MIDIEKARKAFKELEIEASTQGDVQSAMEFGLCLCDEVERLKSLIKPAKDVFNWYYILGENNSAARERLAKLGNAIKELEK